MIHFIFHGLMRYRAVACRAPRGAVIRGLSRQINNLNGTQRAGLSLHPLECVPAFSARLIHWVVASHPIHLLVRG